MTLAAALQELPSEDVAVHVSASGGGKHTCPEFRANVVSQTTFSWLTPLLRVGYKKALDMDDIWELAPPDKVENVNSTFEGHWRAELDSGALCQPLAAGLLGGRLGWARV